MQEYEVTVNSFGTIIWCQNGNRHRLDGPAFERVSGDKGWYQNGQLHRVDGPAIEYASGVKKWYQNGQLHRLDGPAIEFPSGNNKWYIDGIEYTEGEFMEKTNQVTELTVKQISEILGFYVKVIEG